MEDWEDEIPPIPTKALPKSKWDDEDLDDTDIKDSWEDEDEPPQPQQPVAKAPEEKAPKKPAAKATEKKGKAVEVSKQEPLDPVAEKLRQQRLVEEADYKSTTELFAKKGDDKTLDNFIPKSESDFLEYAELVSHKLLPYEKSYHYIALLKAVMRLSLTSLKAADTKDIASSITAIANEKLKAEKEATSKKKTGGKKKQLLVDKPDDDLVVNAYDDIDDYDFIYSDEYTSTIPPARLFKALIVDSHNLIPKLMPLAIKSIEITGDGGAGSIRQINFAEGSQVKYIKNQVEELDEEKLSFKLAGDGLRAIMMEFLGGRFGGFDGFSGGLLDGG
ncbi:hypothetical protein V6N11_061703 [Hibiscus sabdariffa]|uniref:Eukaryotic translation initiation factor 3 subunit J n=1 Tax=Hibiscus sabdariffa TaxID=183260 RepID=A0ABR2NUV8_9ROSI